MNVRVMPSNAHFSPNFFNNAQNAGGVAVLKHRFEHLLSKCDPAGHFICQAFKSHDLSLIITSGGAGGVAYWA